MKSRSNLWLPALLGLVVVAAYSTSFRGEFVLDDTKVIVNNTEIRRLWPPSEDWLRRRFLVDATFALNYSLGKLNPADYHATNLAIHLGVVLLLYGLVRRTLGTEGMPPWIQMRRCEQAFFVAAMWGAHPLTTSAVTYTCQRYEITMGFFYLLTLYAVARGAAGRRGGGWYALAAAACALGMASKEVMITAPVVVLAYDRIFLAGSFPRVLRERWPLYVGFLLSWVLLGILLTKGVPNTLSGPGAEPAPSQIVSYSLTQGRVIAHYLRLSLWPYPLCLDYAWPRAETLAEILPGTAIVGAAALVTAIGLFKWPRRAFPAFVFFAVLAPTSSFLPRPDYAFEHRMYLPLAALVTMAILGLAWILKEGGARGHLAPARHGGAFRCVAIAILVGLCAATGRRNTVFQSREGMWRDVVRLRPGNFRARVGLIGGLLEQERFEEAETEARSLLTDVEAALLSPRATREVAASNPWENRPIAHNQVGLSLLGLGRAEEALGHFGEAAKHGRGYKASYHINSALALVALNRPPEAAAELSAALSLKPEMVEALVMLGKVLVEMGEYGKALPQYEKALHIDPGFQAGRVELAWLLAASPVAQHRDGARGIRLAASVSESVQDRSVRAMEVLAACYAETGAYTDAKKAAERALYLAQKASPGVDNSRIAEIRSAFGKYADGVPLRLPVE